MKVWIARDKSGDINLFQEEPFLGESGKHFYSTEERARYEARIQEHRDGYDWEDD